MPSPPVPAEIDAFLTLPNPSVIATLQPNGSPNSVATWYLWEHGRVLVNMDESRARLDWMRKDPRVSLTVLDEREWFGAPGSRSTPGTAGAGSGRLDREHRGGAVVEHAARDAAAQQRAQPPRRARTGDHQVEVAVGDQRAQRAAGPAA